MCDHKFRYIKSYYDNDLIPKMERLLFHCKKCLQFMCKDYEITKPEYIENDPF